MVFIIQNIELLDITAVDIQHYHQYMNVIII